MGIRTFQTTNSDQNSRKTNERLRFDVFQDGFRMVKTTTPKSAWNFLTKTKETSFDDVKKYFGESVNVNFFKIFQIHEEMSLRQTKLS
jgi:hypothetical protein